ncbi:MAG: alpha/beta hydrolase [Verrucomicrobiales bacterium]|nr:alpha/beta hydrolase [Verrucomicrobiales bacterium]
MIKTNENTKDLLKGLFYAVLMMLIFASLIFLVMGKSLNGGGAERMAYKNVAGKELALWVYKPKGGKQGDQRPCVLWFFGGGWKVGSSEQFAAQSKVLAQRGIVSICAEYRIESQHGSDPFDSVMDARSAMRWVKLHSTELGIDAERIAAAGGSSGGHLALACALFDDINDKAAKADATEISARPAALILFNPVVNMDIPMIRDHTTDEQLQELLKISPFHRIESALPPSIIFQGGQDTIVPIKSVSAFVKKARGMDAAAKSISYITYPGRGHEFYYGPGSRKDYWETLGRITLFLEELGWL